MTDTRHTLSPISYGREEVGWVSTRHCTCGWLYRATSVHLVRAMARVHLLQSDWLPRGGVGRPGAAAHTACSWADCGRRAEASVLGHDPSGDWYQYRRSCLDHLHLVADTPWGEGTLVLVLPDQVPLAGNGQTQAMERRR